MDEPSIAPTEPPPARRSYDSPLRRARAEQTRDRILAASTALAREATIWDWRGVTIPAVAERAGISERTVYRHFASERQLHDAMMHRLEQEAGVRYDGIALRDVSAVTARVFSSIPSFAVPPPVVRDETFLDSDIRRRGALRHALLEVGADWPADRREMAAAVLDVLWVPTAYERLVAVWGFQPADATEALTWAIDLITEALRKGDHP
jgi:AcrR family transcriptional regulator